MKPFGRIVVILILLLSSVSHADRLSDFLISAGKNLGPNAANMMAEDFIFLKSIKGKHASALSDRLFNTHGKLDGDKYSDFFLARINSVVSADCGLGGRAAACVDYGTPVVKITPLYFTYSQLTRIAMLLHESIHAEPSGHPHAFCPQPLLGGLQACADNEDDPYFAQLVFLKNIMVNCDTCSPTIRQEALYIFNQFKGRITNAEVLKKLSQDL